MDLGVWVLHGKNSKRKKGKRFAWLRPTCKRYLQRILARANDMKGLSWEQALKENKYVFRLADGQRSQNINRTFEKLLTECKLLVCPRTEKQRTLYSLRHSYITWALQANRASPMVIADQCGTSVGMLAQHYWHLDVFKHRDALTA